MEYGGEEGRRRKWRKMFKEGKISVKTSSQSIFYPEGQKGPLDDSYYDGWTDEIQME